ncbi:hypothetical protein Nos7524_3192 [Nostoc sp. PCC 7524]|uniref:hypothetical protein n=1 Tax=Nostoc sp. (strain ATCC 29411 / PCC 7524) TaxID=28072 RepID=UPI00029F1546|nr:hypothetical protein [Nostoc sp. PCC 7524]AFY48992.1 hypothetical protein Nos7524_3192 [Nostoc sp. PCC 7524]
MLIYKYQPGQDKLYLPCYDNTKTRKTGYVDIYDLLKCLRLYYLGQLDNVDDFLDRFYLPPHLLDPNNTLFGKLDTNTLQKALSKLSDLDQAAIELHYTSNPTISERMQHYYNHNPTLLKFNQWVEEAYEEALLNLADTLIILI